MRHFGLRWVCLHEEPDIPEAPGGAKWHCVTLPDDTGFTPSVPCNVELDRPPQRLAEYYFVGEGMEWD
jgi:hypothetical protein